MEGDVVIRVENLGKLYQIGQREPYRTLRDTLARAFHKTFSKAGKRNGDEPDRYIWALKEVSFEVERGEVIGIIGRNGAGKSTLLKILSHITEPTEGYVELATRVGSLLEIGTGFHPELTGRENVYLNGAILGMRKAEIAEKFDEIVEFAELEKFVDTPVKYYSSGMSVRLAFAVAAHLEPEILLVDEVLAVGDISFQQKCLNKMGEVSRQGRTVLFVSHNLGAIWSLCPKTIWIDSGKLKAIGATAEIVTAYRNSLHLQEDGLADERARKGTGKLRVTNISLQEADGTIAKSIRSGQPVTFVLDYVSRADARLSDIGVNMIVANDREIPVFSLTNKVAGEWFSTIPAKGRMNCHIPSLPLVPGEYELHYSIRIRGEVADRVFFAKRFLVVEGDFFGTNRLPVRSQGDTLVAHKWHVEGVSNG
jgi:lipopolysaccharide transport system ATP-binding protein